MVDVLALLDIHGNEEEVLMAPPRASTRGDLETRPKFPFQFLTKSSGEVEREMY